MSFVSEIDSSYLQTLLQRLLAIPSPTGHTDAVVHAVSEELTALAIPHEFTLRGAIRATLPGQKKIADRSIVGHLDTLGAMVKGIKKNGRLRVVPIGTWSARFAEGARVTVVTETERRIRGTLLPLKASGHVYGDAIDRQKCSWDHLELRLDERVHNQKETSELGIDVGNVVMIDTCAEFLDNGFINARHLDDKAGVAAILAAAKAIQSSSFKGNLPVECHLLFTISEEVGAGASDILYGDVSELVSVDNGTIAPGQNTSDYGVTLVMQDASGPFDWHLTRKLIQLCQEHNILFSRDIFTHYRTDAASAIEAGNDIRAALICFALDSSHGYERTHIDSLLALSHLLFEYIKSPPLFHKETNCSGLREMFIPEEVRG
ncbi:MAG: osmoprotectant NAGGN system M42 family peptidase [Magnetococcus sp. DMHC-6]